LISGQFQSNQICFLATILKTALRNRLKKNKPESDLSDEERRSWEQEQLSQQINFEDLEIDSAPFQLVESTSLTKIHSLYSLLGLNRCYVTRCGRLVGVVALRDVSLACK
jgi:hypothetical protein